MCPPADRHVRVKIGLGRAAFTLVELLVTIGVIALVIGIIIPALGKARSAGARTACIANLRTLGESLSLYRNANQGVFPDAQGMPDLPAGEPGLLAKLTPYCETPAPALTESGRVDALAPWRCPSDPSVAVRYGTSYDYGVALLVIVFEADGVTNPLRRVSRLADQQPATVLMSDAPAALRNATGSPEPWHSGAGSRERNALRADGSAGWLETRSD